MSLWDPCGIFLTTCLLPSKLYLDIRIHQVFVFSYEGLFDVGHDAGVHLGESFSSVDFQVVTSPLSLRRHPVGNQQVSGREAGNWKQEHKQDSLRSRFVVNVHPSMSSSSDSLVLCGVLIVSPLATTAISHLI